MLEAIEKNIHYLKEDDSLVAGVYDLLGLMGILDEMCHGERKLSRFLQRRRRQQEKQFA